MSAADEPKILAFLCKWCAYAAADLAGVSRFQYPPNLRVIMTMCSGRVDPLHVVQGLRRGFEGVFVFGWRLGDCHYLEGNVYTAKRMQWVAQLLETAGLGRDRLQLRWISSAEAHLFAEYVTELTELIAGLGPLPRDQANLRMAALERTLNTSKIRWLIGMERQLTEKENVFHERLESTNYQTLLQRVTEEEYQKALIFGSLQEGPKTVAEMATQTGLPVYTLSVRLNDLERIGQASLAGHEGTNYLFKIAEVWTHFPQPDHRVAILVKAWGPPQERK